MATQTRVCDACGTSVTYTGHRGFIDAHRNCPRKGTDASDDTHAKCPRHGSLVWVIGPYSAFRACADRQCTEGRRGKPWRYCAPRGEYARDVPSSEREDRDELDTEPDTKAPHTTTNVGATDMNTLDITSLGALGETIRAYVDQRARQLASEQITEALKDAKVGGPSRVDWTVNTQSFATIEGTHHKALPRVLKLYAAGFRNFLIVGPAGSGKTTLAADLARALNVAFGAISCSAGMSEGKIVGRGIPNLATGDLRYVGTDFVRIYEAGGVFLFDEIDGSDPNVLVSLNSATANGHLTLVERQESPRASRHADAVIICAANTYGTGPDRMYVGRNQLDAATLDRFVGATLEVDYDRDLEAALVGDDSICRRVWSIRDKVSELKLRRIVGTRFLLAVTRLVRGAGDTLTEALRACCVGWTADELSRVGIN